MSIYRWCISIYRWKQRCRSWSIPGTGKILEYFQIDNISSTPFSDQIKMQCEKDTGNDHVKSDTGFK